MTTPNINIVTGLKIATSDLVLTYCKNSQSKLCAQFSSPYTGNVIREIPMKDWHNIVSALCTFLHLSGEPKEGLRKRVEKIIEGIQNNLVETK
jgi:hypothetical protein